MIPSDQTEKALLCHKQNHYEMPPRAHQIGQRQRVWKTQHRQELPSGGSASGKIGADLAGSLALSRKSTMCAACRPAAHLQAHPLGIPSAARASS